MDCNILQPFQIGATSYAPVMEGQSAATITSEAMGPGRSRAFFRRGVVEPVDPDAVDPLIR